MRSDALATWLDPNDPVFVSIDDAGVISRIQTPVTAAAVERGPRQSSAADCSEGGLRARRSTRAKHVAVRLTRHGKAVRNAAVSVTYTMLDMPMAPSAETLRETSAGVYSGRGPAVSMSGRWQLAIRSRAAREARLHDARRQRASASDSLSASSASRVPSTMLTSFS